MTCSTTQHLWTLRYTSVSSTIWRPNEQLHTQIEYKWRNRLDWGYWANETMKNWRQYVMSKLSQVLTVYMVWSGLGGGRGAAAAAALAFHLVVRCSLLLLSVQDNSFSCRPCTYVINFLITDCQIYHATIQLWWRAALGLCPSITSWTKFVNRLFHAISSYCHNAVLRSVYRLLSDDMWY